MPDYTKGNPNKYPDWWGGQPPVTEYPYQYRDDFNNIWQIDKAGGKAYIAKMGPPQTPDGRNNPYSPASQQYGPPQPPEAQQGEFGEDELAAEERGQAWQQTPQGQGWYAALLRGGWIPGTPVTREQTPTDWYGQFYSGPEWQEAVRQHKVFLESGAPGKWDKKSMSVVGAPTGGGEEAAAEWKEIMAMRENPRSWVEYYFKKPHYHNPLMKPGNPWTSYWARS